MSRSSSNSSSRDNSNSNIKGGGRASLSDAVETLLIDCLMKRRRKRTQGTRNCNDDDTTNTSSEHDVKRERKRFVKQLVETYERERVKKQVNGVVGVGVGSVVGSSIPEHEDGEGQPPAAEAVTSASSTSLPTTTIGDAAIVDGKVRVELVEAIYSSGNKNGGTKDKKSKMNQKFKSGTKKVLVLPKAITIPELWIQAQNKLRMKKNKPVRVFVLKEINGIPQEINLETNLAGIDDGTSLYVTATSSSSSSPASAADDRCKDQQQHEKETPSKVNHETPRQSSTAGGEPTTTIDPLDAVKQAYATQQQYPRRQRKRPSSGINLPAPHPTFSDHFDSLPPLSETSSKLPAAESRLEILQAVQDHRVVIICGATGCGKSTQVPQFLWQGLQACNSSSASSSCGSYTNILVTQPRRVAATALARRVAQEMNSPLPGKPGSIVGHHVRLDRAIAEETTQIVYCTVGILLRRMLTSPHTSDPDPKAPSSPPLKDITHIIVDEVHERNVETDFLLTLLRAALPRNPHLRLILMSATASAQLFVDYFAAAFPHQKPLVLNIPGRTFPVETMWLEDCQRLAGGKQIQNYHNQLLMDDEKKEEDEKSSIPLSPRATDVIDYFFVQSLIASIIRKQQADGDLSSTTKNSSTSSTTSKTRTNGAILVFLPGKAEIEASFRVLTRGANDLPLSKDALQIYKLHSGIPRGSQQVIFEPAPMGSVKIVLATNIAETSITIPDVSHVIDAGRVKESRYNSSIRIKELVTVWTSHASAQQRAGRAGRTTAGVCYKLYSRQFFERHLPAQTPPEMIRTPLDELILQLCLLHEQRRDELQGEALANFPKGANPLKLLSQVPEPPPTLNVEQACQHLLDVDALHVVDLTPDCPLYRLTPLGFHLSRLPMDAKVGKTLIVGCILECLEGALTIAATLSCSKSCFYFKNVPKNKKSIIVDRDYELAFQARARLIEGGFGGKDWRGGTVKGDLIAAIACYREWAKRSSDKERFDFACQNALDHVALKEMQELRKQYLDLLIDAGFVSHSSGGSGRSNNRLPQNQFQDDALLTSCCLVAGLYPNVCTLMRPRKGGPKGGRLLTKDGDVCRPQMQSFQSTRVQKAAETGKDAYAVYHNKHRSLGTGNNRSGGEVFLSEVNFVSRYALLLFSGELEIVKNAIVLDGWLKFKIGEKSVAGAVLLLALRDELDQSLLQQISRENNSNGGEHGDDDDDLARQKEQEDTKELMNVVRQLLAEE